MSVLEQMAEFERSIVERLRELAPLVREYQELQSVAERLGLDPGPDVPVHPASDANCPIAPLRRRERRQDQVLELVRREPGCTVADIAQRLGVDPTSLYRIVRKLERSGEIVKDGRRLKPSAKDA